MRSTALEKLSSCPTAMLRRSEGVALDRGGERVVGLRADVEDGSSEAESVDQVQRDGARKGIDLTYLIVN